MTETDPPIVVPELDDIPEDDDAEPADASATNPPSEEPAE